MKLRPTTDDIARLDADLRIELRDKVDDWRGAVVVPAQRASWLRMLVPGLWNSGLRLLVFTDGDALIFKRGQFDPISVKSVIWRGPRGGLTSTRFSFGWLQAVTVIAPPSAGSRARKLHVYRPYIERVIAEL